MLLSRVALHGFVSVVPGDGRCMCVDMDGGENGAADTVVSPETQDYCRKRDADRMLTVWRMTGSCLASLTG